MANQAIMARPMDEKEGEAAPELVKDFEGTPLLGPNSLACSSIMSKTIIISEILKYFMIRFTVFYG